MGPTDDGISVVDAPPTTGRADDRICNRQAQAMPSDPVGAATESVEKTIALASRYARS